MLKAIASILGSIVVLAILAGLAFLGWRAMQGSHQLAKAEATAGQAVVAKSAALTKADVTAILSKAKVREIHTVTVQGANRVAIMQAPGASAALDPAFIRTVNVGLCRYDIAHRDDPGCVPLRARSPSVLPPADPERRLTLP
jgi:hypothetical protein